MLSPGSIILRGLFIFKRIAVKMHTGDGILHLPKFRFASLEGKLFTSRAISHDHAPVIINHFDPECEDCQYMAEQIRVHRLSFAGYRIIMVTDADGAAARAFNKKYDLGSVPHLQILLDKEFSFYKVFGTAIVPSFFIYDEKGTLEIKVMGETRIENLIKVVNR